jgi:hypothetical protein
MQVTTQVYQSVYNSYEEYVKNDQGKKNLVY